MQRTLSAIRQFQRSELQLPELATSTVFYPFSGPDVLFLTALFPENPSYIMVGLEPPGSLPCRRAVEQEGVGPYLAGIRGSVSSVLRLSFFRTKEMESTLHGQLTNGVAAPILLLLALSGHRVLSFRHVQLDEQGNVVERPVDRNMPGATGNEGIEVVIEGGAERPAQTLYYFSIDLSDNHLKKNTSFFHFLDRADKLATFMKAASYMPHRWRFASLRKQVLSRSTAILQDDSGIPFRFFRQGDWVLQPYGAYDKPPYELFKDFEQPDLKSAFSQPGVKPLPFRIGYGFGKAPSNLLLAVRRR